MTTAVWLAALLAGLAAAGPMDMTSPLDALSFADPAHAALLRRVDAAVRGFAAAGWRHHPYARSGAFYKASWCAGQGARDDCQITEAAGDARDQHAIALYTLCYGDSFPKTFGFGVQSRWVPPKAGWGVEFYLSLGGRNVVGEGFVLDLRSYTERWKVPAAVVRLGSVISYRIFETELSRSAQEPPLEDFRLYAASAQALRDRGLAAIAELERKAAHALAAGEARACDYGPHPAGIPPLCQPRPLTAVEAREAQDEARRHFAEQRRLLSEDYRGMFDALNQAFPIAALKPSAAPGKGK
ncbi:MAG: hypothetical protein NTY77_18970 [Elusimicrobia bacterium]|nr:hypothetical protein [Elusimicrobiota bacterium]